MGGSIDSLCMSDRIALQQWFDNGGTVADLETRYGIVARPGATMPHLISLKYDMIAVQELSTQGHPLVREARGIVLDSADNYRIVSRAFNRFYNTGQVEADEIDWSTARVLEKLDGSLILCSWYNGEWLISTSGSAEASGEVNGFGKSFAELFWETLDANGYELPETDPGITLIFELTSPMNKIVVFQKEADLTLLGGRDLRTQVELIAEDMRSLYMPTAKTVRAFPLRTMAEIEAALATNNPLSMEGYVVCDAAFRRVKVKDPAYIRLHSMRDGCTPRKFVDVARGEGVDEIEGAFPEFKAKIDEARAKIAVWAAEVDADYVRLKDIVVQKDFALQAVKTRCSSALFTIRGGNAKDARSYLRQVHIDRVMEWIEPPVS